MVSFISVLSTKWRNMIELMGYGVSYVIFLLVAFSACPSAVLAVYQCLDLRYAVVTAAFTPLCVKKKKKKKG